MKKVEEYYIACGIKKGWHGKSLDDHTNDSEALKTVKKYLKGKDKMVELGVGGFLWGANGTGKSHLLNTLFMELIERRCTVRVFTMDEIVDKYTSSWYSDQEKKDLYSMLHSVAFLGIDEFGKNVDKDGNPIYLPDMVKRIMESVIRYRVQSNKPIWFTSNTDPAYVSEVFSEDIASLLREAVIPIQVKGGDYRKVIMKRNKDLLK